jgi:hypothetical protein
MGGETGRIPELLETKAKAFFLHPYTTILFFTVVSRRSGSVWFFITHLLRLPPSGHDRGQL